MPKMPIAALELQEYLYADQLKNQALDAVDAEDRTGACGVQKNARECLRFARFAVINWLLQNGASIPAELITDQAHPPVGHQYPDIAGFKEP